MPMSPILHVPEIERGYHSYFMVKLDGKQIWSKTKSNLPQCEDDGWTSMTENLFTYIFEDGSQKRCKVDIDVTLPRIHTKNEATLEVIGIPFDEKTLWGFSNVEIFGKTEYSIDSNILLYEEEIELKNLTNESYDNAVFACEKRGLSLCPYESYCTDSNLPRSGWVLDSYSIYAVKSNNKEWVDMSGGRCFNTTLNDALDRKKFQPSLFASCCKPVTSVDTCKELCWNNVACASGQFASSSRSCKLATKALSESITCDGSDQCEAFVPKRETCNTANYITTSNLGKWRSKTAVKNSVITLDLGISTVIDHMEVTWGYEHEKNRYPKNIKLFNHNGNICVVDQTSCIHSLQTKHPFLNVDVDISSAISKN